MVDVILQDVLKSVILQQELISQRRQSPWALSVALNFSQPRYVPFYTLFDGNKPCTLSNTGPGGFFSYKNSYTTHILCVCVCVFEIFCTLFIVWVYLLAEDVLIAGVQYSLASGVGSSR